LVPSQEEIQLQQLGPKFQEEHVVHISSGVKAVHQFLFEF
jgi:hypothetical protein